ncbi:MAG TPA: response regulator [Blastocatellia bacterium]|nr:response regulator [Blastocatellia bacterium]
MSSKILVIEDDDYSRDALAHILEAEGYETESAGEGGDGYECALEMRPDVIVLDLGLPGLNGNQFIRMIRADETLRSTPILVVTGNNMAGQAAVELGANACFIKPIEFDALISAIASLKRP